jgi:hypothetical protein
LTFFLIFFGVHCKLPGLDRFAVDFSLLNLIQTLLDTGLRSINGGTFTSNTVNLSMSVPGGADEIRYTVNGSAPDCSIAMVYGGAFDIGPAGDPTTIVQAITKWSGVRRDLHHQSSEL